MTLQVAASPGMDRDVATSRACPPQGGTQLDCFRGMTSLGIQSHPNRSAIRTPLTAFVRRPPDRPHLPAFAVDEAHEPHLRSAADWLVRAQDSTPTGGIARGFSHGHNRYFRARGWQPEYPETTGYIIPTLFALADRLGREDLAARAVLAAHWECAMQLPDGAVQGGVIGQARSPSTFNTGQVIFGWLAAFRHTGDVRFAESAQAAARFLTTTIDRDGIWRRGHSRFALEGATLYNARTAWALLEAGRIVDAPGARDAAVRSLRAATLRQHASGWLPDCCLNQPDQPLLHTLAYAIVGLLEGGRLLGDDRTIAAAAAAAAALADQVDAAGRLAGRYFADWRGAVSWSCLTGEAQMVTAWLRLHEITGDPKWLQPVAPVLRHLKGTQDRGSTVPGIAGGITGSDPIDGDYGSHETLSWATKFFIDAMLLDEWRRDKAVPAIPHALLG
ncbi:MAG: prenyltransferase/squalene oxidase repeat-containing protein [Gemmatimonadaceae bacterium]